MFWNGQTWLQLHTLNPTRMMVGNIEAGGADLIMDYPGSGIWIRRNNGTWGQLHSQSSTAMAVGDFDGDGHDDIAIEFAGAGVWNFMNGSSWRQVTSLQPSKLAAGNPTVTARPSCWPTSPLQASGCCATAYPGAELHPYPAKQFLFADVDGDGRDEIIIDFGPSVGSWIWNSYSGWKLITADSPELIVSGSFN